jgi:SAM-dependent methyltransferase
MVSEALPSASCRLCGSSRIELWGTRTGRRFTTRVFSIHRCLDCDFRFVDPVTGPEIYDEDYYAGRGVDPLVEYEAEYANYGATPRLDEFEGLAAAAEDHFARTRRRGTQPLTWLDYGCGAGGLLKYLRDRGTLDIGGVAVPVEASGFDVGVYADRLRDIDRLPMFTEAQLAHAPGESFDVISLIEVIEHVERPLEVMAAVGRLLRPGGLVLLTTGNLACPLARWQGVRFAYCIPEIHISLWTPRSLEWVYRRAGLSATHVRCDGSIRFKIRKNLVRHRALQATAPLWRTVPIVRTLDWLFGVSHMPMAVKRPNELSSC